MAEIGCVVNAGAPALVGVAFGCRALLCLCVESAFGLPRQPYWLIPVRDVLAFAVFVWSFFGNAVSWRGLEYRVSHDGNLVPMRK